jgi:hypothetical protein
MRREARADHHPEPEKFHVLAVASILVWRFFFFALRDRGHVKLLSKVQPSS